MSAADVADGLEHRSGLVGLAGTDDMREVLDRAAAGDGDALLALDVYVHRLRASIAAMAASLGGIDALVFTGGVGERSAPVRALAAEGLEFLGIALDDRANEAATGTADVEVGVYGAAVRAFVVPAREDVEIARQVREAVADAGRVRATFVARRSVPLTALALARGRPRVTGSRSRRAAVPRRAGVERRRADQPDRHRLQGGRARRRLQLPRRSAPGWSSRRGGSPTGPCPPTSGRCRPTP